MGEPVGQEGSGKLVADWGAPPPALTGYIDTRPPGGRPFREASFPLLHGHKLPVWFAYVGKGLRNTLLYTLKHPDRKPEVSDMDQKAAKLLASRFAILRPKPTVVMTMPSRSWQAEHFAQEVATAAGLPLKTGVFEKIGEIKGTLAAQKLDWARKSYRLLDPSDIEGQSIILADDNVGTGASMSACAEMLYARGAAYVLGVAVFRLAGKKDVEAEDVPLGFAKGLQPEENPLEDAQLETIELPTVKNQKEKATLLRRMLVKNQESLSVYTASELAELYEVSPVEMRFALSQLDLAKLVKPG